MTDEQGVLAADELMRTSPEIAGCYTRSTICTGDLVCSIGPSFGKVMVTPDWLDSANLTQGTARIAVQQPNDARYVFWTLRSRTSFGQWESSVGGATFRALNLGPLAETIIPVPDGPEQTQIAAFLDRETAKIDELVAEQRRLMELLKEKRQAVISHAVTKGLNPDAPMKPSGIEWLGDIPEHWSTGQSRRLFALRNERALDSDKQLTASQEHGVIYQEEFIRLEGRRVVQVIKGADILKHVEPNDFVISMRSFQGGIEWCNLRGCISSAYVMLIPSRQINAPFFSYLLKSRSYIQALQTTSNLVRDGQALRYDNFTQVDLPIVPVVEQQLIADFLDQETKKIDELVIEAQRAINLLQERRTALISAAVTGQIDIRALSQTKELEAAA